MEDRKPKPKVFPSKIRESVSTEITARGIFVKHRGDFFSRVAMTSLNLGPRLLIVRTQHGFRRKDHVERETPLTNGHADMDAFPHVQGLGFSTSLRLGRVFLELTPNSVSSADPNFGARTYISKGWSI